MTPTKTMSFPTPQDFGSWLKKHHNSETELWIKIYKKGCDKQSVTWNEVVIEALCWGWIDGIKKSLDDESYLQRVTPRKANSNWSKRNKEHVERLIKENRMQAAGLAHVEAAQKDGRWQNAYTASEIEVPEDFINALEHNPIAKAFYNSLTKSYRYIIAHGLTSAKKADTRKRRFTKYLTCLENQIKPS